MILIEVRQKHANKKISVLKSTNFKIKLDDLIENEKELWVVREGYSEVMWKMRYE